MVNITVTEWNTLRRYCRIFDRRLMLSFGHAGIVVWTTNIGKTRYFEMYGRRRIIAFVLWSIKSLLPDHIYHIYIRISDRFQDRQRAIGVYQSVLNPPTSICDVTYWLNHLAQEKRKIEGYQGENLAAINTAGE
jgi:hypothetical protein